MKRKQIFLIKWRNRSKSLFVETSISHFLSKESAEKQVEYLKKFFPQNSYYVVPAN